MKPLAKVSVLIVTHNRSRLVTRAIESALAQTGVEVEVLVYDDASDDDTVAACKKFGGGVRVFCSSSGQGPLVLRNRGLREARGEFVFGLDDDAWFSSPTTIAAAVALFRSNVDIAALALAFLEPDRGQPSAPRPLEHGEDVASFRGCAYALKTEAALQVGGFREELLQQGEERDLAIRLRNTGQRIVFCDGAPVVHLFSPAGRVKGARRRPGARNNFLFEWWYAPLHLLPTRLAAVTFNTIRYKLELSDLPARLTACILGLWSGWKYRHLRNAVRPQVYEVHRSLPGDAPDQLLGVDELKKKFPSVERGKPNLARPAGSPEAVGAA